MEKVHVKFEKKNGRGYNGYTTTWETYDAARIYDDLAHEIIAKKINQCTWIRSIKRQPLYTGYDRIIITMDNGDRKVYTITSH